MIYRTFRKQWMYTTMKDKFNTKTNTDGRLWVATPRDLFLEGRRAAWCCEKNLQKRKTGFTLSALGVYFKCLKHLCENTSMPFKRLKLSIFPSAIYRISFSKEVMFLLFITVEKPIIFAVNFLTLQCLL